MLKREIQQSLYSDHEIKHLEDVKRAERLADKTKDVDEKDIEAVAKQTAQDYEDVSTKELSEAKFASRTTLQDKDVSSINRCLDRRLLLMTKNQLGNHSCPWLLPMTRFNETDHDSLRTTAEEAISLTLGDAYLDKIVFLGNSPSSVYSYRYPIKIRSGLDGKEGGRIFFFKATIKNPRKFSMKDVNKELQYQWLTREEAKALLTKEGNKRYWNRLSDGLLYESHEEGFVDLIVSRVRKNMLKNMAGSRIELKDAVASSSG